MLNPYVKKDDILKLVEKLAGENGYINKRDLQKAITFTKEYKKPKENKEKRGDVYRPYNREHIIKCIEDYKISIQKDITQSMIYKYLILCDLKPQYQIVYNNEVIPIEDIVFNIQDIRGITKISKGAQASLSKSGYFIKHEGNLKVSHQNGNSTIPCTFYRLSEFLENVKGCTSIIL